MTVEHTTIPLTETDDLIGDFFLLIETPAVVEESVTKDEPQGYFAETLSWLETIGNTEKSYDMTLVYNIQDMAISQQLLCICAQHTTLTNTTSASHPLFSEFYNQPTYYGMQDALGVDSHAGHEHCDCGGHYKDGKCESCGRPKDTD